MDEDGGRGDDERLSVDSDAEEVPLDDGNVTDREDAPLSAEEMAERHASIGLWHGGYPKGCITRYATGRGNQLKGHAYRVRFQNIPTIDEDGEKKEEVMTRAFATLPEAEVFRRRMSIKLKRTMNRYRWIYPSDGGPRIGQLCLTMMATMLFDEIDLPVVKANILRIQWNPHKGKSVCFAVFRKDGKKFAHAIMDAVRVDFIDGDTLNCCRSNLKVTNSIPKPAPTNENTCPLEGVTRFVKRDGTSYWRSTWWCSPCFPAVVQIFSVKKFGEATAKRLALRHQLQARAEHQQLFETRKLQKAYLKRKREETDAELEARREELRKKKRQRLHGEGDDATNSSKRDEEEEEAEGKEEDDDNDDIRLVDV